MTHDYTRNGVTTWFAALNRLTGPVLSMTEGRASGHPLHRHQAWWHFLKMIDRQTPKNKERHLIVDNYATGWPRATHPHPEVKAWLAKHLRFHRHFSPHSSWLNRVERFFRDITHPRIRRGGFNRVAELQGAINDYIAVHNAKPKPFI